MTFRVLSLFAGIGGFDLGLERTGGFKTVAFCEIDAFCRRVLAKHWPEVPCYDDVRTLTADRLAADGIAVDVICGGFPCQDISVAGQGAGLSGERSGLWREYARLVGELRPRYVIVENVSALLGRGMGDVLGDMASLGYDAEWHCIPASAVGAPHQRDRVWIVAYCHGERTERGQRDIGIPRQAERYMPCRRSQAMADADSRGWREQGDVSQAPSDEGARQFGNGCEIRQSIGERPQRTVGRKLLGLSARGLQSTRRSDRFWATEPDVGRVVDGPSDKVDRRKRLIALGNALVPQIPELIGRAIIAAEARA